MSRIKNIFREWLGIQEPLNTDNFASKLEVKKLVEEAVFEALAVDKTHGDVVFFNFWSIDKIKSIRGIFKKHIHDLYYNELSLSADKEVAKIVCNEKFIDDIVIRIKNKQLP